MVNKELLKLTLDTIQAKPSEYYQGTWVSTTESNVCGTTMCFAGHAAVLAGAEIPNPKKHYVADWYVGKDGQYMNWREAEAANFGDYQSVAVFARNALGLSYEDSDYIFDGDRTEDEIVAAVDDLINDREIAGRYTYVDDEDDYGPCPCCEY